MAAAVARLETTAPPAFAAAVPPAFAPANAADPWWLAGAASVGALIALAAVLIAQRARGQGQLAAARRALAASADWWWQTDASMRVTDLGPGQRTVTGVDPRQLIGKRPWEIAGATAPPPPLAEAIAAQAPFFDQLLDLPVNGAQRAFALSGTPLFSATGNFDGYLGVARDVTATLGAARGPSREQAALIDKLQADAVERTRQFELAVKDLDSFAHSVSHDLRAPLRIVDGFANIVLEDYGKRLDDLGREHVKRIVAAGNRMNTMIDTLLAMSRTTSRELERERVDLSQLARELADELRSRRDAHAAPHNVDFVIAERLVVDGDRTLMRLVLQNLFDNAYKFTGKLPAARIEFGTVNEQGRTAYYVRDNGAGFDMRFADKLFAAFQRFHSQNEFPGTGVGLATVQRIVRRHGGRIWAESEPGKGATFFFTVWD